MPLPEDNISLHKYLLQRNSPPSSGLYLRLISCPLFPVKEVERGTLLKMLASFPFIKLNLRVHLTIVLESNTNTTNNNKQGNIQDIKPRIEPH